MEYKELPGYWEDFRICSFLRLDEAAALLAGDNPYAVSLNGMSSGKAELILRELIGAAIRDVRFSMFSTVLRSDTLEPVHPAEVKNLVFKDVSPSSYAALYAFSYWADSKGIPHHWPRLQLDEADNATTASKAHAGLPYTEELQAAIDAYEAVRGNPESTQGRTPKQALLSWLEENRSNLGSNARERIATMCNWEPQGGAPATPTGRGSE